MANDRLDLSDIKQALILRALQYGFLEPMTHFFYDMKLKWGNTKTAHATMLGDRRTVELGQEFFHKVVRKTDYAVDVTMHEIMHHLFLHLPSIKIFASAGYSREVQNLAMDAIINAYLHKIGCSKFMERFYRDADEGAFLRPNSKVFRMTAYGESTGRVRKGLAVRQKLRQFYERLYNLQVTLEEALEFFQTYFPQPHHQLILLGHHETGESKEDQPQQRGGIVVGKISDIFNRQQAQAILSAIGVIPPPQKLRNNFARIVRKVTTAICHPGKQRHGFRLSKQPPTRLSLRETIKVESGARWFQRGRFQLEEVSIFLDISGSVQEYLPLAAGLVVSLKKSNWRVHCYCWADQIKAVSLDEICHGQLPTDIGGGTNGAGVAQYIIEKKIAKAIVITDNRAGTIPLLKAEIHVCLFANATTEGSFLDRSVVPNSHAYQLQI